MSPEVLLRIRPGVQSLEIDGDVLVYDGDTLQLLSHPGTLVWKRIDGLTPLAVIVEAVVEAFPDQRNAVEDDVLRLLNSLVMTNVLDGLGTPDLPALVPSPQVGWTRDDAVVLLVDLRDGRRRALTPTGGRIWELVGEHRTMTAVLQALRAEYPDVPAVLSQQVGDFIADLVKEGWLERRE